MAHGKHPALDLRALHSPEPLVLAHIQATLQQVKGQGNTHVLHRVLTAPPHCFITAQSLPPAGQISSSKDPECSPTQALISPDSAGPGCRVAPEQTDGPSPAPSWKSRPEPDPCSSSS